MMLQYRVPSIRDEVSFTCIPKQANYTATTPSIMPLDPEYSRYHTHTSSCGIDRSTDIHEKHLQVTTVELPADLFTQNRR